MYPRKGDERLSGNKNAGNSRGAKDRASRRMATQAPDERKGRRQKAGDIGRALRTIYDDTLRENVPDDFLNLLGKLN